jgi:serine O-acetyltransferase
VCLVGRHWDKFRVAKAGLTAMRIAKLVTHFDLVASLWRQIREDWETHNKDWTLPGFRAVAVYRIGHWLANRSEGTLRSLLLSLYRIMYRYIRNHYGIEMRETVKAGRRLLLGHQNGIVIHEFAEFGDDCLVRQNVTIGYALNDKCTGTGPKFGHRVDIGAGAVIVGNVTIGDEARIGPNVVVMRNIPAGATVFMEAPRIIQMRISGKQEESSLAGQHS